VNPLKSIVLDKQAGLERRTHETFARLTARVAEEQLQTIHNPTMQNFASLASLPKEMPKH
jgi:hypothetical protein